jgi:cytoskeletal protein CcmA (bactofilin family)
MARGKNTAGDGLVIFSDTTVFTGVLRFKETLCIQGKFFGTIESGGDLIVDKGAVVEADRINVRSLTVHGKVTAQVNADDKVDFLSGSQITGNITAGRIRIADGVIFEGSCNMVRSAGGVEIFSRPIDEIKNELRGVKA